MKIVIGGVRGIPGRYGGFETSADETARRMVQAGHAATVYCRAARQQDDPLQYHGVQLVYLPALFAKNMETIIHSLQIAVDVIRWHPETEVVHLYNAASVWGGILLQLSGRRLIMTLDGIEWRRQKWGPLARQIWRLSTWLAVHTAHVIICDSQTVRSFFEERYGVRMHYIPYGAKQAETVTEDYRNFDLQARQYFIFVGRLVPEKGLETLLDAYKALNTTVPLVIVGDNENAPEYVASLRQRATPNVRFLGYRYGAEYESLLYNARVYLTASKLEGTSPSLLAAMGAGVCCLVSGIPENRETGGDSILYFDGSAEDMAQQWKKLCADPAKEKEYAERGRRHVTTHYAWDAVTQQYLAAYQSALERH